MRLLGLIFLSLTQKGEVLNVKMFIPFQAGHRYEKNQMTAWPSDAWSAGYAACCHSM